MKKNFYLLLLTGGALLLVLSGCEPENVPPEAFAGADLEVIPPNNQTELKGSATDADGMVVRYEWTLVSGPAGSSLATPSEASTKVEGLVDGVYTFRLRVTDDDGLTGTDEVSVFVGDPCYGCWDY